MTQVAYAVEGSTDEPLAEQLIRLVGREPKRIFTAGGKPRLDPKIPGYNQSARHRPWLVLRDLDHDDIGCCVADVLVRLVQGPLAPAMALRLPVRSAESWLLADAEGFSSFFSISRARIPLDPDRLSHPKQHVVSVCRHSARRAIRDGMVPRPRSGRTVGPEYTALVREFAATCWSAKRAASESPSLAGTLKRVRLLAEGNLW